MHPDVWKTRWKLMVAKFQKTVKSSEPKNADFLYVNGQTTYMMLSLVSKETILTLLDPYIHSYKMDSISDTSPLVRESRFRNLPNFSLWTQESLALESGIQLKEFRIPITIGIPNPVPGIWNL